MRGNRRQPFLRLVGQGLSPRVRGNPPYLDMPSLYLRSIPACAGEPIGRGIHLDTDAVYPRVCGGTASCLGCHFGYRGLSPRVRGNRFNTQYPKSPQRSIPACAGEPPLPLMPCPQIRVYPRVCGEPLQQQAGQNRHTVYPRVCGGTFNMIWGAAGCPGLSPRVRGNRLPVSATWCGMRSIPACAGEPGVSR